MHVELLVVLVIVITKTTKVSPDNPSSFEQTNLPCISMSQSLRVTTLARLRQTTSKYISLTKWLFEPSFVTFTKDPTFHATIFKIKLSMVVYGLPRFPKLFRIWLGMNVHGYQEFRNDLKFGCLRLQHRCNITIFLNLKMKERGLYATMLTSVVTWQLIWTWRWKKEVCIQQCWIFQPFCTCSEDFSMNIYRYLSKLVFTNLAIQQNNSK